MPVNCQVITEKKPGSYAARNKGILLSGGEILGFTDSDCIPDKNWIKNAVEYLEANDPHSRVAGRIDLIYKSAKLTPGELYEKVYAFNQYQYVKKDGTGVTANMFAYRYVFDSVGLFNEELLSGGDYEWGIRARNAGFDIGYGNEVIIRHPARSSVTELVRKAKRVGGGQALFTYRLSGKAMAILYLLNNLRPPLRSFRMVYKRGRDLSVPQKLTVLYIHYYLSVVTAWEKFKVRLGKLPNRA
ncbi:glycosyltransferase [Anseongella ginsenosidimutans]|nr:glycosyltransferase [Anseongella ginsenosidimutans]